MTTLVSATIWVVAIIAMFELGARAWLRYGSRTYPWKPYSHFEIEPDAKVLPRLSTRTSFRANSLGLRGREAPGSGKVFRIVMCGGSAVECFSLDDNEAWPQRVEECLSTAEAKSRLGVDDVHVLNLAKSGFVNESLGYLVPRVLDRVGPIDVLTITTGASSVTAWIKANTPYVPSVPKTPWEDVHWHSENRWGWTPASSATAEVIRRLNHFIRRPTITLKNTGGAIFAGRQSRANATDMRVAAPDTSGWIADYEASLGALVQTASRYTRRIVLLRQSWYDVPNLTTEEEAQFWQGFVGDASPSKRTTFYNHKVFSQLMAETDAANLRVAHRFGIETIRLSEGVPSSLNTYYDQIHFTPEGARQLSVYVAGRLLEIERPVHERYEKSAMPDAATQ